MESQFSGERKFSGDWDNAMQIARIEYDEFEKRSSLITIELARLCILKIVRPSKFQRPLDVLLVLPQINVLWVPGGA